MSYVLNQLAELKDDMLFWTDPRAELSLVRESDKMYFVVKQVDKWIFCPKNQSKNILCLFLFHFETIQCVYHFHVQQMLLSNYCPSFNFQQYSVQRATVIINF